MTIVTGSPQTETVSPQPEVKRGRRVRTGEGRLAFYLIFPTILLLGAVIGYPVVKALVQSFQSSGGLDPVTGFFKKGASWTGFSHYKHFLLQQCTTAGGKTVSCPPGTTGHEFYSSLQTTALFTVITVGLETVIGMGMALMMHRAFRGRGLMRAAILVPWAIPTAVTAKLWYTIFQTDGIANKVTGSHTVWFASEWPSRSAIIIADVWKTTPFIALLILAGLQVIPADLYEAVKVDGASAWQRFTHITLPLVRPALAVAIVFRALDVLRMYDLPAIMTGGANGTNTLSLLVVQELKSDPYSSEALSTLTFLFIFIVAFILVRVLGANIVRTQARGVR